MVEISILHLILANRHWWILLYLIQFIYEFVRDVGSISEFFIIGLKLYYATHILHDATDIILIKYL